MTDFTTVGEESPREVCANLAQTFRALAEHWWETEVNPPGPGDFSLWASRLEAACRKLDEADRARRFRAAEDSIGGIAEP